MSFTTPRTWSVGELVTKSMLDEQIRDNLNAIWKGSANGDLDYYASATAKTRLPIGTNGQILMVVSGVPSWQSGTRYMGIQLNADVALIIGDDKARFRIPPGLNGWNITSVAASRKSGTGTLTIQIRNVTDSVDVLSTKLTVDTGETDSSTAATPAVIDTTKDDVATADQFAIDVDDPGTSTFNAYVEIGFTKP